MSSFKKQPHSLKKNHLDLDCGELQVNVYSVSIGPFDKVEVNIYSAIFPKMFLKSKQISRLWLLYLFVCSFHGQLVIC